MVARVRVSQVEYCDVWKKRATSTALLFMNTVRSAPLCSLIPNLDQTLPKSLTVSMLLW